jgi:hypothetical protein
VDDHQGVARLILVSTTLASLLIVPGMAPAIGGWREGAGLHTPKHDGRADQPEPVSWEEARAP